MAQTDLIYILECVTGSHFIAMYTAEYRFHFNKPSVYEGYTGPSSGDLTAGGSGGTVLPVPEYISLSE